MTDPIDREAVLAQLERILASRLFQHSRRYPAFLQYVVHKSLEGAGDELKERSLGVIVFKRSVEYDTSADPVVRNTASEVRKRLEEYYSDPEHERELRICLPVGGYSPEFRSPPAEPVLPPPDMAPVHRVHRRVWVAVASFAVVAAISGTIWLATPKPAIDLLATHLTRQRVRFGDYRNAHGAHAAAAQRGAGQTGCDGDDRSQTVSQRSGILR